MIYTYDRLDDFADAFQTEKGSAASFVTAALKKEKRNLPPSGHGLACRYSRVYKSGETQNLYFANN